MEGLHEAPVRKGIVPIGFFVEVCSAEGFYWLFLLIDNNKNHHVTDHWSCWSCSSCIQLEFVSLQLDLRMWGGVKGAHFNSLLPVAPPPPQATPPSTSSSIGPSPLPTSSLTPGAETSQLQLLQPRGATETILLLLLSLLPDFLLQLPFLLVLLPLLHLLLLLPDLPLLLFLFLLLLLLLLLLPLCLPGFLLLLLLLFTFLLLPLLLLLLLLQDEHVKVQGGDATVGVHAVVGGPDRSGGR